MKKLLINSKLHFKPQFSIYLLLKADLFQIRVVSLSFNFYD